MNNLRDLNDIFECVKDIICYEVHGKVFDGNVASAIGMDPIAFASRKARNSYPYEHLAKFCNERGISMNWLLFGQGAKNIRKEDP